MTSASDIEAWKMCLFFEGTFFFTGTFIFPVWTQNFFLRPKAAVLLLALLAVTPRKKEIMTE